MAHLSLPRDAKAGPTNELVHVASDARDGTINLDGVDDVGTRAIALVWPPVSRH